VDCSVSVAFGGSQYFRPHLSQIMDLEELVFKAAFTELVKCCGFLSFICRRMP
jgi:hypothetical protein